MNPIYSMWLIFWLILTPQIKPIGIFEKFEDIGNPKLKGSATFDPKSETYTLTGSGYNIWFERDEFSYLFNTMEGNFTLSADFEWEGEGVDPHRKTGWMIRSSTDDGAIHCSAVLHGDGLTVLQWRVAQDEMMRDPEDEIFAVNSHYKTLELERKGNTIIFRAAKEGGEMEEIGKHEMPILEGKVLAGLYINSHNPEVTESIKITKVKIH
jgi:TolB protein